MVDTIGSGYVDLALELGIAPDRIDTIADGNRAAEVGAKTDGNMAGAHAAVLAELAALIDQGRIEVPIAAACSIGPSPRRLPRARTTPRTREDRPRTRDRGLAPRRAPPLHPRRILAVGSSSGSSSGA